MQSSNRYPVMAIFYQNIDLHVAKIGIKQSNAVKEKILNYTDM